MPKGFVFVFIKNSLDILIERTYPMSMPLVKSYGQFEKGLDIFPGNDLLKAK